MATMAKPLNTVIGYVFAVVMVLSSYRTWKSTSTSSLLSAGTNTAKLKRRQSVVTAFAAQNETSKFIIISSLAAAHDADNNTTYYEGEEEAPESVTTIVANAETTSDDHPLVAVSDGDQHANNVVCQHGNKTTKANASAISIGESNRPTATAEGVSNDWPQRGKQRRNVTARDRGKGIVRPLHGGLSPARKKMMKTKPKFRLYYNASKALHPPPTTKPLVSENGTSSAVACSCWNTTTRQCCQRRVHTIHKMGYVLIPELLQSVVGVNKAYYRYPPARHKEQFYKAQRRIKFRSVIVARNLFDTIVSGYLYHKSGNECSKDRYGQVRPANESQVYYMTEVKWEDKLAYPPPRAGQGRTICQYLADESEEDGMRVFIDFSLTYFYQRWYEYWQETNLRQGGEFPFLRIVCYENLADPKTRRKAFREMMEWLFPGGYAGRIDPDPPRLEREYSGGHATNADPTVKRRLRALVEKQDEEIFNKTIARATEAFGCGLRTSNNATSEGRVTTTS